MKLLFVTKQSFAHFRVVLFAKRTPAKRTPLREKESFAHFQGYPKVCKGVLFAKRTTLKCAKDFYIQKIPRLVKKEICFSEKGVCHVRQIKKRFGVEK